MRPFIPRDRGEKNRTAGEDMGDVQASKSEKSGEKGGYVSGGLLQVVARGSGQWVRETKASK